LEATALIGGISLMLGIFIGTILAIIWSAVHIGLVMIPVWIFFLLVIGFTVVFYVDLHNKFMKEQQKIVDTLRR
jgi:UDP-N-acetylmuramyl pentapeptide phosphotransferase/UDP-N-acetylglucosamine-1-phosphate transferase